MMQIDKFKLRWFWTENQILQPYSESFWFYQTGFETNIVAKRIDTYLRI